MPDTDPNHPIIYQIRVRGYLGEQWTAWFDGLALSLADNGDTLFTGPVLDQAALHGLLRKVRDLGISLISVNRVEAGLAGASDLKLSNSITTRGSLTQHPE